MGAPKTKEVSFDKLVMCSIDFVISSKKSSRITKSSGG